MSFEKIFRESEYIITEGGIVERLKAEFNLEMDSSINHAGLIYNKTEILETLYRQYIDVGKKFNLPVMIMTPTRRVNFESVEKSQFKNENIIHDSCIFLNSIKETYGNYTENILIGGLLGSKGDAYSGDKVLNINESYLFHKHQTLQFQQEKVDYLFAGIMPEINEAVGMANAMAETNLPYIISFMIRKNGCLLDGTTLSNAIRIIDEQVFRKPICYMTNCIHPINLTKALTNENNRSKAHLKRFKGIQANASNLSPEELNNCSFVIQDDFENIVDEMYSLKKQFNLKIFGGCCGTNHVFINQLTKKLLNSNL